MPKLSYAQEVTALEETLAAVRVRADVVPPLALVEAGKLAEQIAELKALKHRQRVYTAEGKATTEELHAEMARGMEAARNIRAVIVLALGPKNPRLTQFGISIRRRPRRKGRSSSEVTATPLGHGADAAGAARDETQTAHPERANVSRIGGTVREVGADVREIGGNASAIWGNAPDVGATVPPIGAILASVRGKASEDGGDAPELRGNARTTGGTFPTSLVSHAA